MKLLLKTDKSFIGAVKAQEAKQIKGLDKLEKRLLKAEKKQHSEKICQIIQLQNELFPNQSLQERINNLSEFVELENFVYLFRKIIKKIKTSSTKIYYY